MTKILTQRSIETAKPRAARYGIADGLVPGLRLLVQPSGVRTYALFARTGGRLLNIKIGSAAVLSLADARAKAKGILVRMADGEDPRIDTTKAETVEAAVRRFIERYAKVHNKSWRPTEQLLEREVLSRWRNRPIGSITRLDVVALLDAIVDRGTPITANRVLYTLRKVFNWNIERGALASSPCDRIRAPAPEVKRDRVLTDAELALVWRAAGELGFPFGTFTRVLILTGQRRDEVGGMKWSELDETLTLWTLPPERVKNKTRHQVPISAAVREILTALPRFAGSDFVFGSRAKPLSGFSKGKRAIDGAHVVAHWTLHDLRRTAATGMAKLGIQLPVVEKILNHMSGSFAGVAGIYQRHDFADEKRDALERWSRHVLELVEPQS